MARDDWRVRVELPHEHGAGLLERLHVFGSDARELARELRDERLAVSHEGDTVFVYAPSRLQAEQARAVVEDELREQRLEPVSVVVEQWLAAEDRWDHEPPGPTIEEDLIQRGWAPWEVRVECRTLREARELERTLEAEGYSVARTFTYVFAGTKTREEAARLAKRIHGEVEPGGELVWEVTPQNPFVVFGGLGGAGTPL